MNEINTLQNINQIDYGWMCIATVRQYLHLFYQYIITVYKTLHESLSLTNQHMRRMPKGIKTDQSIKLARKKGCTEISTVRDEKYFVSGK